MPKCSSVSWPSLWVISKLSFYNSSTIISVIHFSCMASIMQPIICRKRGKKWKRKQADESNLPGCLLKEQEGNYLLLSERLCRVARDEKLFFCSPSLYWHTAIGSERGGSSKEGINLVWYDKLICFFFLLYVNGVHSSLCGCRCITWTLCISILMNTPVKAPLVALCFPLT